MNNEKGRSVTQPIHNNIGGTTMLYTVAEVARILKTNIDYVHKLRKSGLLMFMKIGSYKVRKETLEDFLAAYDGKDISDPYDVKSLCGEV